MRFRVLRLLSIRWLLLVALAPIGLSSCERIVLNIKVPEVGISGKISFYNDVSPFANTSAIFGFQAAGKVGALTSLGSYASCGDTQVELFSITSEGKISDQALASTQVKSDGSFAFKAAPANLSTPNLDLVLRVKLCGQSFYRPLSSTGNQDISFASTVITLTKDSIIPGRKSLREITKNEFLNLLSEMSFVPASENDLKSYVDALATPEQASARNLFENIFSINVTELLELPPTDWIETFPNPTREESLQNFTLSFVHWNPSYNPAFSWQVQSATSSSVEASTSVEGRTRFESTVSYTPPANGPRNLSVVVRIGKNDGSGEIDSTKAVREINLSVPIEDTFPPTPPMMSLVGSSPRNFVATQVSLTTGAAVGSGFEQCLSFSGLALTVHEGSAAPTIQPSASQFTLTCDTVTSQLVDLTLPSGDGVKTIALWARDQAGTISSPRTVQVTLDQDPPRLTKTSPADNSRFQATATLVGSCESGLLVEASGAGLLAAASTACVSEAYSLPVTLSAGEGTKALTLSQTDVGGNTTTLNFNLVRDNTAPILTQTLIADNPKHTNTNMITFGGVCEIGGGAGGGNTPVQVTGAQTTSIPCVGGGTWSFTTAAQTSDGSRVYAFTQADEAGNISAAVNQTWVRDTVPPTLVWSTPADNSFAQNQIQVVGTCEMGLDLRFSGEGIISPFSIPCSTGSFNQTLFLSSGQGAKSITLSQEDLASNTTTITRTIIRDTIAPALTQTLRPATSYSNQNTITFGGECETGLNVQITGADTSSAACVGGGWSYTTQAQTTDGTYSYTFKQVDAALNESQLSAQFIRDTVVPNFHVTSATLIGNALDSATFSGTCESNASVATSSIAVTGDATESINCTAGIWSYTPTATTNATRNYTITQTDRAGNAQPRSLTWVRDTNLPRIELTDGTLPTIKNNLSSATWTGTCQTGLDIEITGAHTTTISCPAGTWSFTTPTETTDGSRAYTLTQTNAIPLNATLNLNWVRDIAPPVFVAGQMSLNNGLGTTSFRQTALNLQVSDATTNVTHVCMKSTTGAAPATPDLTDTCWIAVNAPSIGQLPASTVTVTGYLQGLGFMDANYKVYAWARDEVNNISTLSNGGTGTIGRDFSEITLAQGQAPVISSVIASSSDTAYPPLTQDQQLIAPGAKVYIKWAITDDEALPSDAVRIEFTTNDQEWSILEQNLPNTASAGCTLADIYTGCFVWTNPSGAYFKLRVIATDSVGKKAQRESNALNTVPLRILAGNTNTGLGGDMRNALVTRDPTQRSFTPQSFAVSRNGTVYIVDHVRGILKADPATGLMDLLVPTTGSSTGDGGPIENATLRYAYKLTLDPQDNLLVYDYNRIRLIDFSTSPATIRTVAGGGATTSNGAGITDARQIAMFTANSQMLTAGDRILMQVSQSGDLYFGNGSPHAGANVLAETYRNIRRVPLSSSNYEVQTITLSGSGHSGDAGIDLSTPGCAIIVRGLIFEQGEPLQIYTTMREILEEDIACSRTTSGPAAGITHRFNLTTGLPQGPHPPFFGSTSNDGWVHITGRDGKLYGVSTAGQVVRYNHDPTFASGGTMTSLVGTTGAGSCADGQPAATCRMRIRDIFVSETGQIFIQNDWIIKLVDENGLIQTIAGIRSDPDSDTLASQMIYSSIKRFDMDRSQSPSKIILEDDVYDRMYEVTISGDSVKIAGNGSSGSPTTTDSAKAQPSVVTSLFVDPANGRIYRHRSSTRLAYLDRATDRWIDVAGMGATRSDVVNNTPLNQVSMLFTNTNNSGAHAYLRVLGLEGSKMITLTQSRFFSGPTDNYFGPILNQIDLSVNEMSRLAGMSTEAPQSWGSCNGLAPLNCRLSAGSNTLVENYLRAGYDFDTETWFLGYSGDSRIMRVKSGVNVSYHTMNNPVRSFAYRRINSTQEVIYYCNNNNGRILKRDLDTNTETALPWPIPTLSCAGLSMVYEPSRDSVIFPFTWNGLAGIAEIVDLSTRFLLQKRRVI